jgi:hypothetical protein
MRISRRVQHLCTLTNVTKALRGTMPKLAGSDKSSNAERSRSFIARQPCRAQVLSLDMSMRRRHPRRRGAPGVACSL